MLGLCTYIIFPKQINDVLDCVYIEFEIWSWESHKDECISIGNIIVEALDKYYVDNGVYPKTLDELVPNYLEKVPNHLVGNKQWYYHYRGDDETVFELLFSPNHIHRYPCCFYSSDDKEWYTDK
jgi:hypothetical protein